MLGQLKNLTVNRDQTQNITITIDSDFREMFDKLFGSDVNVEIKKASGRRSLDANNYLWHLCGEIAKASSQYSTDGKNEVYREAIRAKGEFLPLSIQEEAVDYFISKWGQKGTGWFAEVIDDYIESTDEYEDVMGEKSGKRKLVHAYCGSSTYDTASMAKIINYVVLIANDLGIPTMTENEKEKLLAAWGKKVSKNEQIDPSA